MPETWALARWIAPVEVQGRDACSGASADDWAPPRGACRLGARLTRGPGAARTSACVRLRTPSLARTLPRCPAGGTDRAPRPAAISALVAPRATSRSTSTSRGVNASMRFPASSLPRATHARVRGCVHQEIAARIREELDDQREAKHVALYRAMLAPISVIRVPAAWPELSTKRLLTLDWLEGKRLLAFKAGAARGPQPARERPLPRLADPFSRYGVIQMRPASRQLHRVLAGGRAGRHQSARLRLHSHLPGKVRRRGGRPRPWPAEQ